VRNEAIHDDVIAILMLKIWGQPHLGFYGRWISIIVRSLQTNVASAYKMSAKLSNVSPRHA